MPQFLNPSKILEELPIRSGNHIADFGSGSGFYSAELAKKVGDVGKVYAFDVVPEACEATRVKAREQGVNGIVEVRQVNLEQANATRLVDNSVDGVVIANILFQAKNKEAILKEAERIIRPAGWIFIVEWDERSPFAPRNVKLISREETKALFDKMPFMLSDASQPDVHHWAMLFIKNNKAQITNYK